MSITDDNIVKFIMEYVCSESQERQEEAVAVNINDLYRVSELILYQLSE